MHALCTVWGRGDMCQADDSCLPAEGSGLRENQGGGGGASALSVMFQIVTGSQIHVLYI